MAGEIDPWAAYTPTPSVQSLANAAGAVDDWAKFDPKPAVEAQEIGGVLGAVKTAAGAVGSAAKKTYTAVVGENEYDFPEITTALAAGKSQAYREGYKPENALELPARLNRARGEGAMLDILREQDPNLTTMKDKFGNQVITYFGKPYYLNRGGVSSRDLTEGLRDTMLALPFAGAAGAATTGMMLPIRAGAQALGGLGSSLLSDFVSWRAGSKRGVDIEGAIGSAVGGAGGEMLGSAVGALINRVRTNPAKFLTRDGALTPEGQRIFTEAGFNPDDISTNVAAEFAKRARQTGPTPATAREVAAAEFGTPLLRGQAMDDYAQIAFEQSAKRDARGTVAGDIIRSRFNRQVDAIEAAKKGVGYDLAPGVGAETPQEAAGRVLSGIRGRETAHGEMVSAAYEQAGEAAKGVRIPKAELEGLSQTVRGKLAEDGIRIRPGSNIHPFANEALSIIDEVSVGVVPEATTLSVNAASNLGVALKALETVRKEIGGKGGLLESAIKNNPTDAKATIAIKKGFDEWLDGVFDDAAMNGASAEALQQYKNARAAASKHFSLFGERTQRVGADDAGKVIELMVNTNVTEQEVANFIWGTSKIGDSGRAFRVANRVKEIVGPDSDEWNAVRLGMWQRMTSEVEGKTQPGAQQVAQNIFEFTGGKGTALAKALYSPDEIAKMRRFATVLKMTVPPEGTVNFSNTGYEMARIIGGMQFHAAPLYVRVFDQTRNVSSTAKALIQSEAIPPMRTSVPAILPAAGAAIGGEVGQ